MSDCSAGMSQQAADIGLLNFKHGYDLTISRDNQSILDNQEDSRGWSQLKLRVAQNSATVDHMLNVGLAAATIVSAQTGQTEAQQTVSPVRTGTGDAIVGTVGVSSDAIAASLGNLATAVVPVITSALATAISQALAALLPVVVTASGGASTPSQTQAKSTS